MIVQVQTWQEALERVNSLPKNEQYMLMTALIKNLGELDPETQALVDEFVWVSRLELMQPILQCLMQVQPHAGTSIATIYLDQIQHKICEWHERYPDDSILEILFALYNALSVDGLSYFDDQFALARWLFISLCESHTFDEISNKVIAESIMELESIGFNTTPYSIPYISDDEDIQQTTSVVVEVMTNQLTS
ncbi:MAG: hypothetical protein AAF639_26695 [Chloroflexota bacterium]